MQEREQIEHLLAQLVKRLKSRDAAVRQQCAQELHAFVATLSRQVSSETFTKVLQQLTPQLYLLLQSSHESDQLGGLAAIDLLIDISNEDQIIRFANYLRNFLAQPNTSRAALLVASTALGHLAMSNQTHGVSGTLVAAFVDFEVKRAFEWLQGERQEALFSQRRLAACFVLRELARAAPTLFHVNLTTFFQSIWGAVRDPRVEIREAATEALSACLQLIAQRQTRHRVQWYCKVYDQVFDGLTLSGRTTSSSTSSSALTSSAPSSSPSLPPSPLLSSWESAHGSLLVIGELLQNTGGFMVPRFREVCDTVLLYKDAKEKLVSRTVCVLLPQLAEFCPDAFVRYYLDISLGHLMKRIANYSAQGERGIAFLSLGKLVLSVGEHVIPQLPAIVGMVREGLATHTNRKKKAKNKLYCIETLTCVANLSRALGSRFEQYLFDDLLEIMMQGGMTDALIDALTEIVASVPSALSLVQERLLNEISIILRGVPFAHGIASSRITSGGAPLSANGLTREVSGSGDAASDSSFVPIEKPSPPAKQSSVLSIFSSMTRGSWTSSASSTADDDLGPPPSSGSSGQSGTTSSLLIKGDTGDEIDIILLSLRTLSCFDFSGNFCLLPFVRDCVALYLQNPDPRIRKQAVITCSKLLLPSGGQDPLDISSPGVSLQESWRHVTKRGPSGRVIDQVLTQLLQVGISDIDSNVRRSVVESLDRRFDELMSQENHLTMAFTFLNDERAEIREISMQLLERIAPRNPAFVMPSMRRVLIQVLTELEHTSDIRMREESTRLLGYLIRGAQHLVDPYIVRVLQVLLPWLVHGNATLASAVLVTIGELAVVSQKQIGAYEHYLFPLIIYTLQDRSSIDKRQIALQTLGQLAGSTACVIRPYLASPKLLEILLSLLHHNAATPWHIRREAMKTIGILGALDPYKYKLSVSRESLQEANEAVLTTTTLDGANCLASTSNAIDPARASSNGIGKGAVAAKSKTEARYQFPKLDLDVKALGIATDFDGFTRKHGGDAVLDEKQQIELELFAAAPIGTQRPDAKSGTAVLSSFSPSSVLSTTTGSYSQSQKKKKGGVASSVLAGGYDFGDDLDFKILLDSDLELDPSELSPSSEAYFPTVAIHALLRILKEPSLHMHHHGVIQAIMFIFKSLSTQCVPFLKYIIPPFLRVLVRCEPRLRESLFLQLTNLIAIVNAHMKPFFPPIMALALRYWHFHLPQIIRLMEKIAQAAPQEFRSEYFPKLLPKILDVLQPHPELSDFAGVDASGDSSSAASGKSLTLSGGAGGSHHIGDASGSGRMHGGASLNSPRHLIGSDFHSGGAGVENVYDNGQRGAGGSMHSMDMLKKLGGKGGGVNGSLITSIQIQVVQSLVVFRDAVEEYVYLLVPTLVRLMEHADTPVDVKIITIYALARICIVANFEHYAGARILQPLARVSRQIATKGSMFFRASSGSSATGSVSAAPLSNGAGVDGTHAIATTREEATKFAEVILFALCAVAYQLQQDFVSFEPLVQQIIQTLPPHNQSATQDIKALLLRTIETLRLGGNVSLELFENPAFSNSSVRSILQEVNGAVAASSNSAATPPAPPSNTRLHVNQQNLRRAWEASQRSTKEDWLEWMRRFSIELLRESPSAALRSCCALAQAYNPLARALFNPAFVSCWNELYEQYQDYLVRALETAFQSDTIPAEILQTLLNLAEFMEHDVEALPIDIRELGELAQKCHAYAKALHYKELEFHTSPSTCIESLISINNQLGQPEAAAGILKYAQQHHENVIQVKETWFEKLQDWEEALTLYDRKIANYGADGSAAIDLELYIGKMRCLEALGRWEELTQLADVAWKYIHEHELNQTQSNRRFGAPGSSTRPLTRHTSGPATSSFHRSSSFSGSTSSVGIHYSHNADDREESPLQKVAMLGARANWCLSQWGGMEQYVNECATTNVNATSTGESATQATLYRSVLAVHHGKFDEAASLIDETRKTLDTKLGALVGESYSRAYQSMITLQQLSELEEIVTYKKLRQQVAKTEEAARYKNHIVRMWHSRLSGCKRVVEVWQQILAIRSLILSPQEDIDTWLQFASLCRQSGNLTLSLNVFTNALAVHSNANGGMPSSANGMFNIRASSSTGEMLNIASQSLSSVAFGYSDRDHNRVAFAYLKHLWAVGDKSKALTELHQLVTKLSSRHRAGGSSMGVSQFSSSAVDGCSAASSFSRPTNSQEEELAVKCHLKLAEWQLAFHEQQLEKVPISSVLSSLKLCTELEPRSYKAWHAWALMNFHVVEYRSQNDVSPLSISGPSSLSSSTDIGPFIAPAIEGFFRSIALGRSRWAANVQQDILRVLTLWFAHGNRSDVHAALVQGFSSVSIETWLIVIPQLIARIHTPYPRIQTQLHRLLCAIGAQHPHALIYPLSVSLKSPLEVRQRAAEAIMNTMRRNYVDLVDEALLVSRELIRVAILWHEMWHEGLEEASRLYFGEHDLDGMVAVLEPLHLMMDNGPETLREVSFQQAFGHDLREAQEWLQRFLNNRKNESDLNRAWDLYYHVFRRINKQLPQLTTLELQYVSPNLLQARNLQLAVPGTYRAGHAIVKIGSFVPTIQVITSKQRPRRITLVGSNGLEYMFLLKGHEDLRQDERVTQLFGLVNALLINDRTTSKKDLKIHRYPVIPLSHNAGIVGWVPHCDTLHQLIRDYREARKILLNIEHRLMLQMAPDYDALSLLQKVEVFEYALENTAGQDLYKVLWLKSDNSEIWLERRTNYTRSLAVMSMVGYILGLGDRHPSNLMLHRFTGTIVHIDFGDCFEVAMQREKYPEKIPFRLTRMLTNAMEVSGIEGNFRFSCESVMQVLRENRHSLMAMLEAFVHDPLICWRLLAATNVSPSRASASSMSSSVATGGSYADPRSLITPSNSSRMMRPPMQQSFVRTETLTRPQRRSDSISIPDANTTQLDPPDRLAMVDGAEQPAAAPVQVTLPPAMPVFKKPSTDAATKSAVAQAAIDAEQEMLEQVIEATGINEDAPVNGKKPATTSRPMPSRALPPRPSTSRPMSISNSIMIRRMHAPPAARSQSNANAFAEDNDDPESRQPVERINYATTNLHHEISSLAASLSSVGQGSLSRRFSQTRAEAAAAVAAGVTTMPAQAPTPVADEVQESEQLPANGNGGVVRAQARRRSMSQAMNPPPTASMTAAQQQPPASVAASQSKNGDLPGNRTHRERELVHALGPEGTGAPREALNEKAVAVIRRVQAKLTGRDFELGVMDDQPLDVRAQVQRLIHQATSHENLCQCYIGWCPFW